MSMVDPQHIVKVLNNNSNIENLDDQRDLSLEGKPDHGEVVDLADTEVLYQSSRKPEGVNVFIYGEIEEHTPTGETVLSEVNEEIAQRVENYFQIKYGNPGTDIDVDTAEYEEVGQFKTKDYLKL